MSEIKINKNLMNINHTAKKRSNKDIKYIFIHYVGALGDAKANTDYYKSTYVGASADFWVGFSGDIWQGNDYRNYYSWAVGGTGNGAYINKAFNSNSVSIEMCVRKRSTKTMNATDKDWYFEDATVESSAKLTAYLMKELDIDIDHVIRHFDRTGKICPNPFVYNNGKTTWIQFKQKVLNYYNRTDISTSIQATHLYRVRKSWTDSNSQIGAYESLENAKNACPPGYSAFDENGKAVYTNKQSGTQASDFKGLTEAKAAAKILELAHADYIKTGVLASVTAAQMILESGYVTTELSTKANNCFGMKKVLSGNTWENSTWDGKSVITIKTAEEYTHGKITYINAEFRKYPCIEDSVADHSAYLLGAMNGDKLRYDIKGLSDYKKVATLIKQGGYATDSSYVSKICNIIERYDLNKYDGEYKNSVSNTNSTSPNTNYKIWDAETTVKNTPLRKNAGQSKTLIKKLPKGTAVTVIGEKESSAGNLWYRVKVKSDNTAGYIYHKKLQKQTNTFKPYTVKVTSTDLYIRAGAGTSYSKQGFTGKGTFTIVQEKNGIDGHIWGLLKAYEKSQNGWIAIDMSCVQKL